MRTAIIVALILTFAVAARLSGPMRICSTDLQVLRMTRSAGGLAVVTGDPLPPPLAPGDPGLAPPQVGPPKGRLAWVGGMRRSLRPIQTAGEVTTVAADGSRFWAAIAEPASLARFAGPAGQAEVTIECASPPVAATVAGGALFWVEARPARLQRVKHIPAASALDVIRSASTDGGQAQLLAVEAGSGSWKDQDLLGVWNGRFYWLQRSDPEYGQERSTVVSLEATDRGPLGETRRVEAELEGLESAALCSDHLFWTAPSREMDSRRAARCVWRRPVGGGEPEYLTDWLPARGALAHDQRRVYYVSTTGVWLVPPRLSLPREVWRAGDAAVAESSIANGNLYVAATFPSKGGHRITRIVKAPLGLHARIGGILRGL